MCIFIYRVCMHIYIYVCVCVYIYIYIHIVCVCVYIYIYIYIHTGARQYFSDTLVFGFPSTIEWRNSFNRIA